MLYNDLHVIQLLCVRSWCGPCKMLIPRLETLVSGKDGKVILAKIDIDENTDLAMNYEVIVQYVESQLWHGAVVCLSVCCCC